MLSNEEIVDIGRMAAGEYMRRYDVPRWHWYDVYSDALYGIAQALARVDWDRSADEIHGYCFLRARGAIIDGVRQRNPGTRLTLDRPKAHSWEKLLDEGWSPGAVSDRTSEVETIEQLRVGLCAMRDQEREIFVQHDVHGVPLYAMADHHGVTPCRISQIRKSGMRRAKEAIEEMAG